MLSLQELLPHLEILESGERLRVPAAPRPYSIVTVGADADTPEARWLAAARLFSVAWESQTFSERPQVLFGSETILVGPGEDLEAARLAFSLARAGELLEAHPPGSVALVHGALPSLDAASDEIANRLLEALSRARAAGSCLVGHVPHPSPALFDGWLRPGERSPWCRVSGLHWCYVRMPHQVTRLEAYAIDPADHDRVAAICAEYLQKPFSWVPHPEATLVLAGR